MAIKRIGLSSVAVIDVKQSTKFFRDILGLTVVESKPELGWCEFKAKEGNVTFGLAEAEEEVAGTNATVSFIVDDLAKTMTEFEAKGVEFISEVIEVPGDVKLVLFSDPDGNEYYLVEELDEKHVEEDEEEEYEEED